MFKNLFKSQSLPPVVGSRERITLTEFPSAIYAIGDVHGCLDELRRLQQMIVDDASALPGRKLMIYLGDYVDRGPKSAAVIDFLSARAPENFDRINLCGNHEAMMLNFIQTLKDDSWLKFGGIDTLSSYSMDAKKFLTLPARQQAQVLEAHMPQEHIEWLERLPIMVTVPGYVFVHAGLRPGVPLAQQQDRDLLWIRDEFLDDDEDAAVEGMVVVHGHTPGAEPVLHQHRICVDTAAYASGVLTAVRLRHGEAPTILATK